MFSGDFNHSYNQYLLLRGYDPGASKLLILKRALVDSWSEPGFHRFWRVWNPGIGHLLYHLYLLLGGRRRRLLATLLVFVLCGIGHDLLVMLIFRRPFLAFTAAFTLFGLLAATSRRLEPLLRQESWPKPLNAGINLVFLAASVYCAVRLQMVVFA